MQSSLSKAISDIKAITLRLRPREDLKVSLDQFVKVNRIKAACIITCAGSLEQAAIRFAGVENPAIIKGKSEIVSLTGTLSEEGSHLHIIISDSAGKTIGGHLKKGALVYTTAEIVIGVLPQVLHQREEDVTYGYQEL